MLTVCTFLWSDPKYRWNAHFVYSLGHVNRLFRGVSRNLSIPHKFVCVTDAPQDVADATLDRGIHYVPLWDDLRDMGGCYTRLRAFAPDMADILGPRFVWIDVDCVVTGTLDAIFSRPDDFVAWKDVNPSTPYCGSMMMQTAGTRAHVWEAFDRVQSPRRARVCGYIGTDQAHIGAVLGRGEATWDERDGVWSFSRMVRQYGERLAPDARIVFFHGRHDPSYAPDRAAAPWIAEHWV